MFSESRSIALIALAERRRVAAACERDFENTDGILNGKGFRDRFVGKGGLTRSGLRVAESLMSHLGS